VDSSLRTKNFCNGFVILRNKKGEAKCGVMIEINQTIAAVGIFVKPYTYCS